ncbi:MAG: Bug family tripartite tricarboxylate transporter substrate binding protein [Burkholderiales bacterium]
MMNRLFARRCIALGLASLFAVPLALAQKFPEKAITLVLTVPPGGPIDTLTRVVAAAATGILGQAVIVESRAGGLGVPAVQHLQKQPADGYTLLVLPDAGITLLPLLQKIPPRRIEDFTFVGAFSFAPNVLAIRADIPAKTLAEFISYVKARPGKSSYGTMLGVPQYIDFERLKLQTGIDTLAVPYAGAAPVVTAMMGGQIDATIFNAAAFAEPARAGKLRVLATTAPRRIALMPEVPTFAEAGFPNVKTSEGGIYILVGPVGMAKPVVDVLYRAFVAAAAQPETRKKLEALGFEPYQREGEALRRDLARDLEENETLIKTLPLRLE